MPEIRKTVCNRDCPDACSVVAHVEDGRVVQLGGDPDHPVTNGFLCWRTNNFLPLQYSPERLTTPLLRGKPVSWDEALDFAASELLRIRAESGPAAIFHYRSGGSLGALKHLSDYFFEQFGPTATKRGDICSGAGDAAQLLDFGEEDSHDIFDLLNSRNVILWGKNPVVSSPHLVPVLKQAKASKLLIDPVWHKTARLCDAFVQPRPGGDFSLAMAAARLLFERGWTDPGVEQYCDNVAGFRAMAFQHGVTGWCEDADVSPEVAEDIARRLHEGPTAILVGWGMARRVNGGAIVRALDALGAISGNLGVAGGGVSYYFKRRKTFDHSFIKGIPAAPRTVLEPLFGPEVLAFRDPPIRAIWITAGNPVAMLPESATVDRALRSRDFVCVVDSWPTDTTRTATLVLPTTTLLEDDDLVGAYGHHWVGASKPVVPPPPGVKSDLQILQELSRRVGLDGVLAGTPREWKERILRKDAGFTVAQAEAGGPQRSALSPKVLFEGRKFATRTGRVNLITSAPDRAQVSAEYPLYLMALSTEKAQSSQWSKGQPPGPVVVTVHPDAAHGIPDGGVARLESALGSLPIQVRHDPQQRRDVALMSKGGHLRENRSANVLAKARTTDIGGGGALYDEPVRIAREGWPGTPFPTTLRRLLEVRVADIHAEKILILDFGSQYTQLIARRIRELHVYCEIQPCTLPFEQIRAFGAKGIVLSGGPASVEQAGAPMVDAKIFELGIPVLGVCYGLQLMAKLLGGAIDRTAHREYGPARLEVIESVGPFRDLKPGEHLDVWMSHGDKVSAPPRGFRTIARTPNSPYCAVADTQRRLYALQFHAEVAHTPRGKELYEAFLEECGVSFNFKMGAFAEEASKAIRERVGKERVICALSGGVDSAVVALLLHKAIGPQLQCIFVDNGVLREGESFQVEQTFKDRFHVPLRVVNARKRFLDALKGVTDPEQKRKIIGREFIAVFEDEVEKDRREHGDARFLAQGTLYPDVIESVSFKGPSAVIKSHHNVGGLPERMKMQLVEPLRELFKDEVRALGRELGLPEAIVARQPFPGPGLAIRILGEVTEERLALVRKADAIVQEEVANAGLREKLWQAFAVLLPVKSVGVMGDERTYESACVLRAVESLDGMTADWAKLPWDLVARISSRITNEVRGVNRVVLDVSSKPPATIEWE